VCSNGGLEWIRTLLLGKDVVHYSVLSISLSPQKRIRGAGLAYDARASSNFQLGHVRFSANRVIQKLAVSMFSSHSFYAEP
jgi:hypothetical protein